MADTKISELPVASVIASPDVAPVVRAGVTMQADVSLFGVSFLSADITRVDPSGSDSGGMVGNSSKPFLTVQSAIDAIEAFNPPIGNPIINIGASSFGEEIITALTWIGFVGGGNYATPFSSLTLTETTQQIFLTFYGTEPNAILASTAGGLTVELVDSTSQDIINSAGPVQVEGDRGGVLAGGTISAPGFDVTILGFPRTGALGEVDSLGSNVTLKFTVLGNLTAAASVICLDSRIITNNAGIVPTYTDILLNPALMDFSTLPTTEPTIVGSAWIDTTGGLNIVKVHL